LQFSTLDGVQVGAYLMTPKSGHVKNIMVEGHGYGGREQPQEPLDSQTASLNPIAPGFHLSECDGIPSNNADHHVVHGLESKDRYVFRVCAAAWWTSASVMLELFPDCADTLSYKGWSYGGGMGCLMLPWDRRYTRAELGQVSFCQIPIRLDCPCVGSGRATAEYVEKHPEVAREVLPYFDGAFAAKRISVPTVFACSLFDPSVPPPGQFCAYNECRAPKRLSVFSTGHFEMHYEEAEEELKVHQDNCRDFGIYR
jgi:cephalosporin-C deacetylase